jgi:rubrerythrin
MEEKTSPLTAQAETEPPVTADQHEYVCDRCGSEMIERNCKVVCPNCGNRFDCSDLNLHFD